MGMDLWYDVMIQELADVDPDGPDLLEGADDTPAPETPDEVDE